MRAAAGTAGRAGGISVRSGTWHGLRAMGRLVVRLARAWARGWTLFVVSTARSQPPLAGPEPWRVDAAGGASGGAADPARPARSGAGGRRPAAA